MNILHITPYYAPAYAFGGVVRAVEGLARALARRGHAVTVLTTDALNPKQRYTGPMNEIIDGVRVVHVPNLLVRGTLNLSTPLGFGAAARPLIAQADAVHCHEFRTVENLIATPVAAKHGKSLVLSPHGTLTLETGRGRVKAVWDALFSGRVARRFTHVVGLTRQEADEARAFWGRFDAKAAYSVVPNGIDLEAFADLRGRAAFREKYKLGDARVCLFLGRLHPRKGPHLLARAFQQADVPGARLVIAGGDEGALPLIQPYLNERVVVTGFLNNAERLDALAGADVFALPAVGEGLSMAALEAMAAGLPVILSPGCNLPEAASSGAGLEVPLDGDALANALRLLLTDAAQRQEMGCAAQRLVGDQFTWDAAAAGMEAIYIAVSD